METAVRVFQINSLYTIKNLSYYYNHIGFQINVSLPCETSLVHVENSYYMRYT